MMTRLTDGTTTVTLSGDGAIIGCSYFPQSGENGADTAVETITLIVEGTDSTIRAKLDIIEQLLNQAAEVEDLMPERVYIEFQTSGGAITYRSQVHSGRVAWSDIAGRHRLEANSNIIEVAVIFTRDNWWDGPETEVYLSSNTQSERVGGVTVYNNDNATNTNWVGIASNRITGNLPTPLKLRILNASGGNVSWTNFYICNNVNSAPSSIDCWLLGSEAAGGASVNWTGSTNHNMLLYAFTLSSILLGQCRGRYFRVLLAFVTNTAGAAWRAGIYSIIGGVYAPLSVGKEWNGVGGNELIDLGALPISPGGYNVATAGAALVITARSSVSGSAQIDFVQLMATDSYRRLQQIGYGVPNGAGIEDNGIDGGSYYYGGGSKYPIVRPYYDPIMVWPRQVQRLFILFDEDVNFVAGRQMTVQAWYRPRVRSV